MKSLASMPFLPPFRDTKAYYHPEGPVPVSFGPSEPLRPVEIRRYIRTLRENRRFTFTHDFLH
jgi:hypothetical protein